ncbi:MAG: MATE family efflux transporter [Alloprevotella sp.]
MNRRILQIAIPSIISNLTVPLLSMADTAIAGHLDSASCIGAIALGSMVFSMVFWLFGFLRMGTGGLTAQACGAGNREECLAVLARALSLALVIGLFIIALQRPILDVTFRFVTVSDATAPLVSDYFSILVWGAPAVLSLYAFCGWFLGMQDARSPMVLSVFQNLLNVLLSLVLVFGFRCGVSGIALGTLCSQCAGLLLAVLLFRHRHGAYLRQGGRELRRRVWHLFRRREPFRLFFRVNRDIFLRTLFLLSVTTSFTAYGALLGDTVLAANAILMQFFLFFSYFMDGFAYSGEALGGHCLGACRRDEFLRLTKSLFVWGAGLAVLFFVLYGVAGAALLRVFTTRPEVVAAASESLPYVCLLPFAGVSAFLFDGLFIGVSATRSLCVSMAVAAFSYFLVLNLFPPSCDLLWTAFLTFLFLRSLVQAALYRKVVATIPLQAKGNS